VLQSQLALLTLTVFDHRPVALPFRLSSPLGLSALPLRLLLCPKSTLLLTLLELLLLRRIRISVGSAVSMTPPALANRMRISVRETTPTKRPEIRAPGSAEADTEGPLGAMNGGFGEVSSCGCGLCDEEKGSD